MDPISTARYGMMAAVQRLDAAAANVVNNPEADYGQETVNLIAAKQQFSANLSVVKVADQMWQSLLDLQTR
jgi:flagellar hook protein FlgE